MTAPERSRRGLLRRPRLAGVGGAGDYSPPIRLRSIDGHVLRTALDVYAWYRLAPQRWSFRSDSQRQGLIQAIAAQYAELSGRWLHLRVTARPYPVEAWSAAHERNAVGRLPDVADALGFEEYLAGERRHLVSATTMVEKEVYLGVQVQVRTAGDRLLEAVTPFLSPVLPASWRESLSGAELAAVDVEVAWLDQIIASAGLAGRPATPEELSWLMYRSCGLGLPAPAWVAPTPCARREPEDLAAFTDAAALYAEPYAPTVTVRGRTGANAGVTRSVAVLSVGQMDALRIPEAHEPWVQRADRVGSVEVSARIYVCRPDEVAPTLTRQMSKIRSQVRHYGVEHDLEPPRSLARQAARALVVEDEMTMGFTATSARVRSWWRFAVSAPTESETLTLAHRLCEVYRPQVAVEHPEAQYALAREFIPGEPLASGVHQRRGSVVWAAAAVPQATASIGDRRGVLLGTTAAATTSPVAWDPWMSQELRASSGLSAVIGTLGSGKSFLCGGVVYKTLRAGARWDVLDPSGQLTALCRLPELAPYARSINLLDAQPGILNPYRVVAEPELAHYEGEADPDRAWRRECAIAAATRRRLVLDVLSGLLPYEVARMAQTRIVLMRAVRAVGGVVDAHPGQVFDTLRRDASEHSQHAEVVADFLDEMRERLALLIPESGEDPYSAHRDDRLTVLTMNGLILPKAGVSREYWTDAETLGIQLLNLAAWLVQRSVYDRPRDERKGVWIDEAFFLSEVPTGRVLMDRFNRDSRKWNIRVLLSSQVPRDFLDIPGFASLMDSAFVGQLDDEAAQADALRLLRVATGVGYEQMLGGLARRGTPVPDVTGEQQPVRDISPRHFVFGDGTGAVERVRIDFGGEHLARLRAALETTPRATLPDPPVVQRRGSLAQLAAVSELVPTASNGRHVPEKDLMEAEVDFDPARWGDVP